MTKRRSRKKDQEDHKAILARHREKARKRAYRYRQRVKAMKARIAIGSGGMK